MTATEVEPKVSLYEPLVLTPEQTEAIKNNFHGTVHYIYASEETQKEFDNLTPKEVGAWIEAWPGGQTDLSESLFLMRAKLLEEALPTSR